MVAGHGLLNSLLMERTTFFEIMTSFPTGVAVVTTANRAGTPFGFTSNAVSSVSDEPPMLLVCVARTSRTLPALLEARGFLVNFMGEGSEDACTMFASKAAPAEKFASVEWTPSPEGFPLLHTLSVAHLTCRTEHELEAGSHVVFIGRVVDGAVTDHVRHPIAYFRRAYRSWPAIE